MGALLFAAGLGASAANAAAPLSWLPAAPSDAPWPGLDALDCPSASLCVAADRRGGVLSTTAPLRGGAWRASAPIVPLGRLAAISCPSAAWCFAVDTAGNLESGPTSGGTLAWSSWNIDLLTPVNAISCPSASLCVAVDDAGRVLASATPTDPMSWSLPISVDSPNRLNALSCPTARLCVAVDSAGKVLVSTDPTSVSAWHATPLASTSVLSAVSCNTGGLCVAVARDGSVYATADVATPPVTWSATTIDLGGGLSAVSCSNVGLRVALDRNGNAFESDNPASGQPVWSRTAIDAAHGPTGASFRPVRLCVVVDSGGNAIAGTLPEPTVVTTIIASQTGAQISATVDPNDANVVGCHFDYGLTTGYGLRVPCSPMPGPTGGSQAVRAQLDGLAAATAYHFRITAESGVARAAGNDANFTTPAPLSASPSLTGTAAVGFVLTCHANIPTATTPTPPTVVAYVWLADGTPVAGATAATYRVTPADATHHLRCQVSISGDGATTTALSGFDSIPSQTKVRITETHVGAITHRRTWVRVPLTCSPQAAGSCTITVRLTALRIVLHRKRTITIGAATDILAAGATHTVTVWVNGKGQLLLKKRHRLRVTLTVTGTVVGTLAATLLDERLVLVDR